MKCSFSESLAELFHLHDEEPFHDKTCLRTIFRLESACTQSCNLVSTYGWLFNPIALGTAKTLGSFGCSECSRVKIYKIALLFG